MGTIRYNNGVRSNSVTPAVAGVEQERAILRCMSVGTVDVRLQKRKKGGSSVVARGATRLETISLRERVPQFHFITLQSLPI